MVDLACKRVALKTYHVLPPFTCLLSCLAKHEEKQMTSVQQDCTWLLASCFTNLQTALYEVAQMTVPSAMHSFASISYEKYEWRLDPCGHSWAAKGPYNG